MAPGGITNPRKVFEEDTVKQHNQVLNKFGRASVVALLATGLTFAGIAPASALVATTASGDFVKSIARIEVPVQEEVEDFSIEKPYLDEVKDRTWKCPDGYATTENPVVEGTQCFKEVTENPVGGACSSGFTLDTAKNKCTKQDSAVAVVDNPGNEIYKCPEGYGPESNVKKDTPCTRPGSKSKRTVIKSCSGVLIDSNTVVSLSQCLLPGDPHQHLFKENVMSINQGRDAVSGKTLGPAKITFGAETLPGAEHTYWANTARAEGGTQLMAIRTDRPVNPADGTPVKEAKTTISIGDQLNVTGWQEDAGKPELLATTAKAGLPYLVNYTQRDPRFLQTNWDDWKQAPKGFNDASTDGTIGKVTEPNVRKGYVLEDTPMSEDVDLGSPTFNNAGELAGMYIGAGMFLDLGEARAKEFIYKRSKQTADGKMELPVPTGAYEAYKQMQKLICVDTGEKAVEAVEGKKRDTGIKELDSTKRIGGYPTALETNGDNTVYRYAAALQCNDLEASKPMSIGSAQAWGKKLNETLDKVMAELQTRSDKAIASRDRAISERDQYDDALKIMKTGTEGFNPVGYDSCKKFRNAGKSTTIEIAKQCLTEMQNNVPVQVIDGIVNSGDVVIPGLEPWLKEANNLDSDGATIKKHLEEVLDILTVKSQRKEKNAEDEQVKADKLATEIKKKDDLNTYRSLINGQLESLVGEAIKTVDKAQNTWKFEADKSYSKFVNDYSNYKQLVLEIKKNKEAIKQLEDLETTLSCDKVIGSTKDEDKENIAKCNDILAQKGEKRKRNSELEIKAKAEPYQNWKVEGSGNDEKIVPPIEEYAPDHGGASATGGIAVDSGYRQSLDAIKTLPRYLLYSQHLDRALQGISSDLANKGFKDKGTIAKIHKKIDNELTKARQKQNEALADKARIDYTVDALEKKFSKVPERLKHLAKAALEAARGKRQFTTNAINSINDAVTALEKLEKQAKSASSTDAAVGYEKEATDKSEQIRNSMNTVKENLAKVSELDSNMDDFVAGKGPGTNEEEIDPNTGKPKTKEQIEKEKAEKERKEKEEAEKRAKEEADKKKAEEEAKKKAEEEKKKADDEAKKDEARLAKALSKNTLRAEGTDRVLTSIAAWKMGKFPGDSLVLVDGNVHADGLSATPFAAALKAPVLLTCWNTGLEPALMDQIKASGKKKLFLVGGQVPMTPYDEFELRDAGLDIFRIAGPDRYATSVGVNQATEPLIGAKPKKPINLYIGDGVGFPDALVAGAAAGRVGGLMLLSKGKQLDPQTYNYISNLGQTRPLKIIPVGGPATAAVKNTPWPTTMSINIAPIVGKDRYETAAKLATTLPGTRAAVLATGENFADALSGGPLAVDQNATLVLTRSQELPPASYQSLQRFGSEKTIVMGGKSAVSPKVAELINGATLKNTDTKTVLGTLLERKKLRDDKANQEAKERRNALSTVRGMIKDSNSLKDVMSQLGFGSIDDLTKLLNDFKAQQDKDKKPDTAKPELDKSSTTTGK